MHTTASDGVASVRELLDFVAEHRPHLNAIAITDHDTLDASLWAYEHQSFYPFDVIPGVEVTSTAGHILALWVTKPIPAGMDLRDTAAAIHEAGGLAILAHPFHFHMSLVFRNAWRYLIRPEVLSEAGIDGVEAHNAGVVTPISNWLSHRLGRQLGIAVTGSSDAHTNGAIGSGLTRFPGQTAHDLRHALENAQTRAEGRPWPINDYIQYLQHMMSPAAASSLETTSSSQPAES